MRVDFPYGAAQLSVELPPGTVVVQPEDRPGAIDEKAAVLDALRSPIGCPRLRQIVGPGPGGHRCV